MEKENINTNKMSPSQLLKMTIDSEELSRPEFAMIEKVKPFDRIEILNESNKPFFSVYSFYCKLSFFLTALFLWMPLFYFFIVKDSSIEQILGNSFTWLSISIVGLIPIGCKVWNHFYDK